MLRSAGELNIARLCLGEVEQGQLAQPSSRAQGGNGWRMVFCPNTSRLFGGGRRSWWDLGRLFLSFAGSRLLKVMRLPSSRERGRSRLWGRGLSAQFGRRGGGQIRQAPLISCSMRLKTNRGLWKCRALDGDPQGPRGDDGVGAKGERRSEERGEGRDNKANLGSASIGDRDLI